MDAHKLAKIALIVGGAGFAVSFAVGYSSGKAQGTAGATEPGWYTATLGRIDSLAPSPGAFGWLAIAGAGVLLYQKFAK